MDDSTSPFGGRRRGSEMQKSNQPSGRIPATRGGSGADIAKGGPTTGPQHNQPNEIGQGRRASLRLPLRHGGYTRWVRSRAPAEA